MIERAPHEIEHEARVVVVQVRVRVLEPAVQALGVDDGLVARDVGDREQLRRAGEEAPEQPVEPRAHPQLEPAVAKAPLVGREEPDLFDRRGVRPDQVVARAAELGDQPELEALHVLDPAPGEVGGLLAGEPGEIRAVDQRHARPARREARRGHRAVDAAAHDQHVKARAL
ncbi:MAG: hypothetical protein V9G19_27920 [Tetrasphaera sp.]